MDTIKKVLRSLAPTPAKSDDGRDQWPSRAAFLLAAMGGCAGMGNLLRYPSQMFNNPGLQWFVPYLMTVFLIAIPVLILEIAIGQAYRGGCVVAYNAVDHRLKGLGLSLLYVGLVVSPYFVVNLAWIMSYFRHSFTSPLPWKEDGNEFYMGKVVANPDPIPGTFGEDGSITSYVQYPAIGLIGETVGWTAFTWFLVYISIFRGVGLTGRVVYFTMGLPIVITIVLIGRSLSLDNAGEGVRTFWGTWNSDQLAKGTIWQTACGQVFFSTGVGFGYFTSYASYNQKHSNAIMDSILIVCSNVMFENIAAFAVFGVVGFLRLFPEDGVRLGGFTVGFLTLPSAVAQMPGANFWAVILFFTLMVLGYSSAFAMVDALVTLIMDAQKKLSRPIIVSIIVIVCFLLSLPYCTEFGYYLLSGIDRWTSDVALVFVVYSECVCSTTFYRWRDVVGQVGKKALIVHNAGYLGGMLFGLVIAHTVHAGAGAGAGFGIYFAGFVASLLMATVPDTQAPRFFGKNVMTNRIYYLAFYSGNQLRHDLNQIVGQGKNWSLPFFWAPMIRYIAAPILSIVYSFSYPGFYEVRNDPLHIMGFAVGHIALVVIFAGFMLPRWFNVLIPAERRSEGKLDIGARVLAENEMTQEQQALESGSKETNRVVNHETRSGEVSSSPERPEVTTPRKE